MTGDNGNQNIEPSIINRILSNSGGPKINSPMSIEATAVISTAAALTSLLIFARGCSLGWI